MTIEIVDFPMKHGGAFPSYVNVYQRVTKVILFFATQCIRQWRFRDGKAQQIFSSAELEEMVKLE